jgi:hypothetical protein
MIDSFRQLTIDQAIAFAEDSGGHCPDIDPAKSGERNR